MNILKTYPAFGFEISFVNIISNNNLVNQGLAMIRQNVVNFLCCCYIYNDSISFWHTKAAKNSKSEKTFTGDDVSLAARGRKVEKKKAAKGGELNIGMF